MSEKKFHTGELNLNYNEESHEGTPILLLHGIALRWQSFHYVIQDLNKNGQVYAIDLRGHGKSERAKSYRMQEYLLDLEAFIKDCIKEPAVIYGHSLGGMLGIMMAANNPELVKGLIIGDSIISPEYLQEFSEGHREKTNFWRNLAETDSMDVIIDKLKNELVPVPHQEGLVPAVNILGEDNPYFPFMAETYYQLDPAVLRADENFNDTYAAYQPVEIFPKIQCPVLLMQGNPQLGALMRDEDVANALDLLPNGQHIKIITAGHFLHMQDKEAVIKAMVQFIESIL